jgi:hypothetical protein
MCASGADVMERARWDGARGTSRDRLLTELQRAPILLAALAVDSFTFGIFLLIHPGR